MQRNLIIIGVIVIIIGIFWPYIIKLPFGVITSYSIHYTKLYESGSAVKWRLQPATLFLSGSGHLRVNAGYQHSTGFDDRVFLNAIHQCLVESFYGAYMLLHRKTFSYFLLSSHSKGSRFWSIPKQ